jgi:hypothetical protein
VLFSCQNTLFDMVCLLCLIHPTAYNLLTATIPTEFGSMTALNVLRLGTLRVGACVAQSEFVVGVTRC